MCIEKAGIADIDALTERRPDYLAEDNGSPDYKDTEVIRNALQDYLQDHLNRDLVAYVIREDGIISGMRELSEYEKDRNIRCKPL